VAWPFAFERETVEPHAWLWKTSASALSQVSFARPLQGGSLARADDDSLLAIANGDAGAQRFEPATQKFVLLAERPKPTAPLAPPEGFPASTLLEGSARLWLESANTGLRRSTFFQRNGVWSEGPMLPSAASGSDLQAVSLAGARVAVLVNALSGPLLFVAGEKESAFHPVELHGRLWSQLTFPSGVAGDGSKVQVVTWSYAPQVATHIIDTETGEVTDGPLFARPRNAAETWRVYGGWVPGGGLLLVGNGMFSGLENPVKNAIGLVLLIAELGALALLFAKRKLVPGRFVLGMIAGLVPLAGLGLWLVSQIHL